MSAAARYPEHARLRAAKAALGTDFVESFLRWCERHGVALVQDGVERSKHDIIHRYADIDPQRIEDEKCAMIADLLGEQ